MTAPLTIEQRACAHLPEELQEALRGYNRQRPEGPAAIPLHPTLSTAERGEVVAVVRSLFDVAQSELRLGWDSWAERHLREVVWISGAFQLTTQEIVEGVQA